MYPATPGTLPVANSSLNPSKLRGYHGRIISHRRQLRLAAPKGRFCP